MAVDNISIGFFVPIYNEESSVKTIRNNILRSRKVFPNCTWTFSDNNSEDNTVNEIKKLSFELGNITLLQNKINIGFSENLASVKKISDGDFIVLIGANDILYTPGLRHLKRNMRSDVDIIISNWAYIKTIDGKIKILTKQDVFDPFEANTLDKYFSKHQTVPNGIMQWCARKNIYEKICLYTKDYNPQAATFIHSFPCNMIAISNPPLALVEHVDKSGWRAHPKSIYKAHMFLIEEVITHLYLAYQNRKISKDSVNIISRNYISLVKDLINDLVLSRWGSWEKSTIDEIKFYCELCILANRKIRVLGLKSCININLKIAFRVIKITVLSLTRIF